MDVPRIGVEVTEAVLGLPLFPQEGHGVEIVPPRIDVREFACHAVLKELERQRLGGVTQPDFTYDEAQLASELPISEDRRLSLIEGSDQIQLAGRLVQIGNNFAEVIQPVPELPDETNSSPRLRLQSRALQAIARHAQSVPADWLNPLINPTADRSPDVMAIIAPTGAGKTVIEAQLLNAGGLQKPIFDGKWRDTRALGVMADLDLMKQYLGLVGDDTFQRFLEGDIDISSVSSLGKNLSGRLLLATRQITPQYVEKGEINNNTFDLAFIDEGHRGMAPQLREHIPSLAARTYLLTATPAYSEARDLRKWASNVVLETPRGAIESNISNAVQLFTFRAGSEPGDESRLAARLAWQYIQEGRNVAVYAKRGNQSAQAREIAELVNQLYRSSGALGDIAGAVGNFDKKSSTAIKHDFSERNIRCICTVDMLQEGWNDSGIDAVIVMAEYSLWRLTQKVGRASRISDRPSILAEIFPPLEKMSTRQPLASLWSVFELDNVIQGHTILPITGEDTAFMLPQAGSIIGDSLDSKDRSGTKTPGKALPKSVLSTFNLPADLQTQLIVDQPVRSMLIAPGGKTSSMEAAPADWIPITNLTEKYNVPIRWLQRILDRAGIAYAGVWQSKDEWEYTRWYNPQAEAYLRENPPVEMQSEAELSRQEIAELYGMTKDYTAEFLAGLKKAGKINPPKRLSNKNHQPVEKYGPLELQVIDKEVGKIPVAEVTDVIVADLVRETKESFVYYYCKKHDVQRTQKRRNPLFNVRGFANFVSAEDAKNIRSAWANMETMTDDDIGLPEIAELADVEYATAEKGVQRFLEKTQQKDLLTIKRRSETDIRPAAALPRAIGIEVAQQLKRHPLQPTQVTLDMMAAYFSRHKHHIARELKKLGYPKPPGQRILGYSNVVSCYPWEAIRHLQKTISVPASQAIDFNRVVKDMKNATPDEVKYSQEIQTRLLPDLPLAKVEARTPATENDPDIHLWASIEQVLDTLNCTPYALQVLMASHHVTKSDIKRGDRGISALRQETIAKWSDIPYHDAPETWVSHDAAARHFGVERLRNEVIAPTERMLARNHASHKLDIFYSPKAIAQLRLRRL